MNTRLGIDLMPVYDSRKSFYDKAWMLEEAGVEYLVSYNTPVVKLTLGGKPRVAQVGVDSNTSLRHVKEYLKQRGFTATTKKQIVKDYVDGWQY